MTNIEEANTSAADVHSKDPASVVMTAKKACVASQENVNKSLASLHQELNKNLKKQMKEQALEQDIKSITEVAKTMAEDCSVQLTALQQNVDTQAEAFDWTEPGILVDDDFTPDQPLDGAAVSSPENSDCKCASGSVKRVMKDSQLPNDQDPLPRINSE